MTTNLVDLEARLTELRDDAKQIEADITAAPHAPAKAPPIHWLTLAVTFAAGLAVGTSALWLL